MCRVYKSFFCLAGRGGGGGFHVSFFWKVYFVLILLDGSVNLWEGKFWDLDLGLWRIAHSFLYLF